MDEVCFMRARLNDQDLWLYELWTTKNYPKCKLRFETANYVILL